MLSRHCSHQSINQSIFNNDFFPLFKLRKRSPMLTYVRKKFFYFIWNQFLNHPICILHLLKTMIKIINYFMNILNNLHFKLFPWIQFYFFSWFVDYDWCSYLQRNNLDYTIKLDLKFSRNFLGVWWVFSTDIYE